MVYLHRWVTQKLVDKDRRVIKRRRVSVMYVVPLYWHHSDAEKAKAWLLKCREISRFSRAIRNDIVWKRKHALCHWKAIELLKSPTFQSAMCMLMAYLRWCWGICSHSGDQVLRSVSLTGFPSQFKFDGNFVHSHLDSDTVIRQFCTWHHNCAVVACAKFVAI